MKSEQSDVVFKPVGVATESQQSVTALKTLLQRKKKFIILICCFGAVFQHNKSFTEPYSLVLEDYSKMINLHI